MNSFTKMPFFHLFFFLLLSLSMALERPDKHTYIIHMDHTKLSIPFHSAPRSYYASSIRVKEENIIYTYDTAFKGFSATLTTKEVEELRTLDGLMGVYPDEAYHPHTTYTPSFLGLGAKHGGWAKFGIGSDTIIGLLDTGIWPEHPAFQVKTKRPVPRKWRGKCETGTAFDPSYCNGKIVGARYFLSGYESNFGKINSKDEYRSARDNNGHGTHTASTAAGGFVFNSSLFGHAKGVASGMAPGARIAAYKVCWSLGCSTSDILAGIDAAVKDGVDVLSLSLGGVSNRPFYLDGIAVGTFGAVSKGVFVTCSAGNSGPTGASISNGAPWIITVAASSVDRTFPATVVLADGSKLTGSAILEGKPLPTSPTTGLAYSDYCLDGSVDKNAVNGKIVVCERGLSARAQKGLAVLKAGGVGMILLNQDINGEEIEAEAQLIPSAVVGTKAAGIIRNYIQTDKRPQGTILFGSTTYHRDEAPSVASFSSRGPNPPSPEILKPDITAPGINILAAWPQNLSPTELKEDNRRVKYNMASGTSMSCPHVSGIAALVRSAHPEWSPAVVKSALMTTAYSIDNKHRHITDLYSGSAATPFALGAGHVNPVKVVNPGLVFDIDTDEYEKYLCALNYTSKEIGMFTGKVVPCPKTPGNAGDLNYPSLAGVLSGKTASMTLKRKVTNAGPAKSKYRVKVASPRGLEVVVNPRRLDFTKKGQSHMFTVSFKAVSVRSGEDYFGSLTWEFGGFSVRSPFAITIV